MGTDRYIIRVWRDVDTDFVPIAVFKDFVETGIVYNCCMDCVNVHDDIEEAQVWDDVTKMVLFTWVKANNYPGDDCDNDCGYDPYLGCFTNDY